MANTEGHRFGTVLLVGVVAVAAAFVVKSSYDWSRDRIAANERARVVARLNSVLDPALRSRDLTTTNLGITDPTLLGSDDPIDVFVLSATAQPVAVLFASVAPHGYNASISLLIGVSPTGEITGVRAVRHRETTGLGDAIDAAKSDWIEQFTGKTLAAAGHRVVGRRAGRGRVRFDHGRHGDLARRSHGGQEHVVILRAAP